MTQIKIVGNRNSCSNDQKHLKHVHKYSTNIHNTKKIVQPIVYHIGIVAQVCLVCIDSLYVKMGNYFVHSQKV